MDVVVFDTACLEFGHGFLKAKAIDDRIGCAVMVELLKEPLPMDCTFVFTVQEEVAPRGLRGSVLCYAGHCPGVGGYHRSGFYPGMPGHKRVLAPLGKGRSMPIYGWRYGL